MHMPINYYILVTSQVVFDLIMQKSPSMIGWLHQNDADIIFIYTYMLTWLGETGLAIQLVILILNIPLGKLSCFAERLLV